VSTVSAGRYCTKYIAPSCNCTVATTKVRETGQEQAVGIASAAITKSRQKVSTNPTANLHIITNTPAFESSQRPLKRRLAEKGKTPGRRVVTRQRQHIAIAGGAPTDTGSLQTEYRMPRCGTLHRWMLRSNQQPHQAPRFRKSLRPARSCSSSSRSAGELRIHPRPSKRKGTIMENVQSSLSPSLLVLDLEPLELLEPSMTDQRRSDGEREGHVCMQQLPRAEMLPIDGTARLDTTNKGSMEQWRQVTTALNAERRSTPPEKLVWAHPYSTSRALSRNTATANAMELVVELVERSPRISAGMSETRACGWTSAALTSPSRCPHVSRLLVATNKRPLR
jgi:hypothetical protein